MTTPGTVFQTDVTFQLASGDLAHNIFTHEIQAFSGVDWEDVADDVKVWLGELYADYLPVMADTVQSTILTLSERDKTLGQWNQVHTEAYTALVGTEASEQTANQISPHINAFPASVRHRGGKYLPPVSEGQVSDGLFNPSVTTALGLFAIDYILTRVGTNTTWFNGVMSQPSQIFRRFIGTATFDDRPSAVQSRKAGVGE